MYCPVKLNDGRRALVSELRAAGGTQVNACVALPSEVQMTTTAGPAAPGGVTKLSSVGPSTCTAGTARPPRVTVVAPGTKLVPRTRTGVSPSVVPRAGVRSRMVGGCWVRVNVADTLRACDI